MSLLTTILVIGCSCLFAQDLTNPPIALSSLTPKGDDYVIHGPSDVARFVLAGHVPDTIGRSYIYEGCTYTLTDDYGVIGDFPSRTLELTAACMDHLEAQVGFWHDVQITHKYVVTMSPSAFAVDQMEDSK